MCRIGKSPLWVLLAAVFCLTPALWEDEYGIAAASEMAIEGAVSHVHRPGGRHFTYFDIVVGPDFSGRLPEDIKSISVVGPNGDLPVGRDDFEYNPQWRAFWIVRPGIPDIGTYTFKLVSGADVGFASDTQSVVKTIPIPDGSRLSPGYGAINSCMTPSFVWPLMSDPDPLYYQLQVRDTDRRHVYRTDYVKDMSSLRLPPDVLQPGRTYQWRVRVADGPNWKALDNRSQSKWVTFSKARTASPCDYRYEAPVETDDGWDVSSLAEMRIDPEKISGLVSHILDGSIPDIHSLLLVKDGNLVLEEYFHGYTRHQPHPVASVTKSITSILIGIAMDRQKINDTDQKMSTFFPADKTIGWDDRKKEIRLRDVLTMTAGLEWNDWQYPDNDPRDSTVAMSRSDDWIQFVLDKAVVDPPGKHFAYNNGLSMLLGEVLRNTTGVDADRFAEVHLFGPLGISNWSWGKRPDGMTITAWGLSLRPRDMAKIGYMMLRKGKWNGRQVLSTEWVDASTKSHVQGNLLLGSGYGYQWWRGHADIGDEAIETFYAAGKGGQYIFAFPALELIAVVTSKPDNDGMGEFRPQFMMVNGVLPSLLPPQPARKRVEIDPKALEKIVGDYECRLLHIPLRVFREGSHLFFKTPGDEKTALFPTSETHFSGIDEMAGPFSVDLKKGDDGEVEQLIAHVGFGFWAFDKIKKQP